MEESRRLDCLRILGVDVWRPRRGQPSDAGVPEPPDTATSTADAVPVAQLDWDDLLARVATCQACPLHEGRTHVVPGVGARDARWMIIGEAPGAEEDRRGEPFVGPAGQLLDAMLRAIGLDRSRVYISNIVKCRPPGNRDPSPEESAHCAAYLERQIALIRPDLILAVGRVAAQRLLDTSDSLARLRGRGHRHGPSGTPVVVTYHPAYLLRKPEDKAKAWQDLLRACQMQREVSHGAQ